MDERRGETYLVIPSIRNFDIRRRIMKHDRLCRALLTLGGFIDLGSRDTGSPCKATERRTCR